MRPNTMVWMGIRHVGDATWETQPKEVPAREVAQRLAGVMAAVSLASRIELVVARSESEVLVRLADARGNVGKAGAFEVSDDMWADMEAQILAIGEGTE
jgi:hypothetical protein